MFVKFIVKKGINRKIIGLKDMGDIIEINNDKTFKSCGEL